MINETVLQAHRYRRYYQRLEPLFKSVQTQAYTMVILSLFTITFFGIFAIRPTLKTIASLQRKITDNSEVNQKLEDKINSLIQAQEEYQRVESDLPLIFSLLPDKPEFPSLLRRLENLAIDNNATISGIAFDPIVLYASGSAIVKPVTTTDGPQQSTPMFFTLTFSGGYQNLVSLLDQLTKLDRLVTIKTVSLAVAGNLESRSTLSVSISSRAYYFALDL